MLYPHLQPECDYVKRYLIRAHDTAPHEHEGLTLCKPASLGVQAEVRALEARLRRHGLFGRPLFFDVLADDADRRSATGCSEVGGFFYAKVRKTTPAGAVVQA